MIRCVVATLTLSVVVASNAGAVLPAEIAHALRDSTYIYLQSERKSGEMGKPAEIWFSFDEQAVYVGTRPTSWRVRRIKAGRRKARIAVGKADGPSFAAVGELRHDPALEKKMMAEYARKYPAGWSRFADSFRDGFKSGERVLVRYTPAP